MHGTMDQLFRGVYLPKRVRHMTIHYQRSISRELNTYTYIRPCECVDKVENDGVNHSC